MSPQDTCVRCGAPLPRGAGLDDLILCESCSDTPLPARAARAAPARRFSWRHAISAVTLGLVLAGLTPLPRKEPQPEVPDGRVVAAAPQAPAPAAAKIRREEMPEVLQAQPRPEELPLAELPEVLPLPRTEVVQIERMGPELPEWLVFVGPQKPTQQAWPRRNRATEDDLRQQLAGAEDVGLGTTGVSLFQSYVSYVQQNQNIAGSKGVADCTVIPQLRPDLGTLPLRDGPACTLAPKAAAELDSLSRQLRVYLNTIAPLGPNGTRPMDALRERLRQDLRGKKPQWLRPQAVPTLNQMLMAEDAATRRLLVDALASIPQKPATVALAQRAAFDLDVDVRAAAAEALRNRDPEVWRPVLLRALGYPWPPPADFAAEALVRLKDQGAVPDLISLLDRPRPGRPVTTADRRVVIREVVKIHHLSNCQLCHPPAMSRSDPVIGADPVYSIPQQLVTTNPWIAQALPQISQAAGGHDYAHRAGQPAPVTPTTAGPGRQASVSVINYSVPVLLRGDITFLRQDFSVSFPVSVGAQRLLRAQGAGPLNPAGVGAVAPTPPPVRFDYVVRTRPVQAAERKKWQALQEKSNPQRDAALFALRELTGHDHGQATEAWVRAFPLALPKVRSVQLADRLLRADTLEQAGLLQAYRDGAGIEYTWALARAIPRLSGVSQEVARTTLVNRLAKQPADELRRQLKQPDVELRRAAARACAQRYDRGLAADLVPLLDDATTAAQAREALKKLTGPDA